MKKEWVSDLASGLLILLFLYTGVMKTLDHQSFLFSLEDSPWSLLHKNALWISWFFPAIEIVSVILLAIPKLRLSGFYLSSLLMVSLFLYVLAMVASGVQLPCSCGGIMHELSWTMHIYFNLFFSGLSIFALINERKPSSSTYSNTSLLI